MKASTIPVRRRNFEPRLVAMVMSTLFAGAGCSRAMPSPSLSPAAADTARPSPRAARAVNRKMKPQLRGYWGGVLVRNGAAQEIALTFDVDSQDQLHAFVEVPNWDLVQYPAEFKHHEGRLLINVGSNRLQLAVDLEQGRMRGAIVPEADAEAARVTAELTRRLAPPWPSVRQEPIEFSSADGVVLAGTIVLPARTGAFAAILLVQGRSYGSREQFLGHAVRIARRGIAALVFDGRGVGTSGGERGRHTRQQRLRDTEAAIEALRRHPQIDPSRVGILGHSAGGWIVPEVAQAIGDLAFVVLHSAPAVDLASQQAQVVRWLAVQSGEPLSPAELRSLYQYQEALTRLAMNGAPWSKIQAHVATAEGRPWARHVDRPQDCDDAESVGYYRRNPHDSTAALKKLTAPTLALYGAKDWVVAPEFNVPALDRALRSAGNPDYEIVVFPQADHGLMIEGSDGKNGKPPAWAQHPPGYFELLLTWLERVSRPFKSTPSATN